MINYFLRFFTKAVSHLKDSFFCLDNIEAASTATSKILQSKFTTTCGFLNENRKQVYKPITKNKLRRRKLSIVNVNKNLLRPGLLSSPSPYVYYGVPIQISTDKNHTKALDIKESVLSGLITDKEIGAVDLCHGSMVLASSYSLPCRRNLFTLINPTNLKIKHKKVKYGDNVYIRLYKKGSEGTFLYLQALMSTFSKTLQNTDYDVRLSEYLDEYCKFKIVHSNIEKRKYYEGSAIPSNHRICMVNLMTNSFLVTKKNILPTYFGAEREISCYRINEKDVSNFWKLKIQK